MEREFFEPDRVRRAATNFTPVQGARKEPHALWGLTEHNLHIIRSSTLERFASEKDAGGGAR